MIMQLEFINKLFILLNSFIFSCVFYVKKVRGYPIELNLNLVLIYIYLFIINRTIK